MHTRTLSAFVALAGALVFGCGADSGQQWAREAHDTGKGTTQTYGASFNQVWRAAHVALDWSDAGAPQDHLEPTGESYVLSNPDSNRAS